MIAPATGTYTGAQTVTITDPGATIFYTIDGSAPSISSTKYTAAFVVNATTTVRAIATETGFSNSAIAQSVITISSGGGTGTAAINFGSGFTAAGLQFNGHTKLNGTRLQLTDTTALNESASAFWTTPVNVQSFTNDFTFQLTSPTADGFTFTIQNTGITALGPGGGGLGFGPDTPGATAGIGKSVAVKFDLYSNAGEGINSTGLYTNGVSPTTPATALGGNVNLHSGDILKAHITYDGTTLTLTITDTVNTAQTFTTSWPINIPSVVGANTAFVGFTAGTGGSTATQEILTWTYSTGSTGTGGAKTPVVYQTANLAAVSSGPTFRQFTFTGFPDTTGTILDATAAGQSVTMTLTVATAGTYDIKVSTKLLNTRGVYQLAVNGANVGALQDEYNATGAGIFATLDLGNFNFAAAGSYTFKFTVMGKNAASTGFSIAFDDITPNPAITPGHTGAMRVRAQQCCAPNTSRRSRSPTLSPLSSLFRYFFTSLLHYFSALHLPDFSISSTPYIISTEDKSRSCPTTPPNTPPPASKPNSPRSKPGPINSPTTSSPQNSPNTPPSAPRPASPISAPSPSNTSRANTASNSNR